MRLRMCPIKVGILPGRKSIAGLSQSASSKKIAEANLEISQHWQRVAAEVKAITISNNARRAKARGLVHTQGHRQKHLLAVRVGEAIKPGP